MISFVYDLDPARQIKVKKNGVKDSSCLLPFTTKIYHAFFFFLGRVDDDAEIVSQNDRPERDSRPRLPEILQE